MPELLPLLDDEPSERSDAARNRAALLCAGRELVARCGAGAVTMEAVAERAGVGKGTVFRRFTSREGLMAAVLDADEREWQAAVISGPPPLGPGADPWERLVAFGRSRLVTTLTHADLIRAAGGFGSRSQPAHAFTVLHLRHLLRELGVTGDLPMLATALLAPLEVPLLDAEVGAEDYPVERVLHSWLDLARRITAR